MNIKDPYQRITTYWIGLKSWIINTPHRAVLAAYRAAWEIRNIEIQQFNGQKISPQSANYSGNLMEFWQGDLNRNLTTIKIRLAEFNLGMTFTDRSTDTNNQYVYDNDLLEKLKFIDEVIANYTQKRNDSKYMEITQPLKTSDKEVQFNNKSTDVDSNDNQKKGVFPGSIARTLSKIAKELYTIMRNIFINNYRRRVKQNTIFDSTPNDFFINYQQATVSNDAEASMKLKEIQNAVHQLPDIFKNPFMLYFEGFKYHEIAEALEEPLGTIKSRIHFARKLLKEQISRN
nr:sigma factor-like helix-turn-helix DNA-binding protein [Cylindrospermopsis raciborskii]